jgi:ABC-type uncharacterized transport system substrate-binding protein
MRVRQTWLFLAISLGTAVWSFQAAAQQPPRVARVAILSDESTSLGAKSFEPFALGLRDLGYLEGQNITFERAYANGKDEILPRLASDLVRTQPNVVLAIGTPATRAAKASTLKIPIVFARIADPIGLGLVNSLARPGGNVTGVSLIATDIAAKWLEMLIAAVPDTKRVAILWDPDFPASPPQFREIEEATGRLGLEIVSSPVRDVADFDSAIEAMLREHVTGVVVLPSPVFAEHPERIAEVLAKARLPAIFGRREQVEAGGLISYGANYPDMYRRAASYVDKILKGAKASDLPVEQPTKLELVINLKSARALGLTIPFLLLQRADEVIE